MKNINTIINAALDGDKPSISRLISLSERDDKSAQKILEAIYPHSGNAYRIGITGPPGVGKSTLVDKLVERFCKANFSVAVIAVDPCSPFTGGALLGDRVRMVCSAKMGDFFFRSMSAGNMMGGLAQTAKEASRILDACGKQIIIVETVGVGQSELDIMMATDTVMVVLTPESGDRIQIMKAGLLEIADIFVVNKSDRPGANDINVAIQNMLDCKSQVSGPMSWHPLIFNTAAVQHQGITELYDGITLHRRHMNETAAINTRRELQYSGELRRSIEKEINHIMSGIIIDASLLNKLTKKMRSSKKDPQSVAKLITRRILPDDLLDGTMRRSDLDDLLEPDIP